MSIDTLQSHYGFTRMPFARDIPPQALNPYPSHREAIARIDWCVSQRQLGLISGEVGAGKTVAVRAALAGLEPSRHQVIYIPDPTITMRGIHTRIVTALGGTPAFFSGVLASQTAELLAGELDERARLPVVVIDEAHLLTNTDLEALRMLTNSDMDTGSHFAMLLIGQPTLRRRLKLAVLSALDQRISTRYTITGMNAADTTDYIRPIRVGADHRVRRRTWHHPVDGIHRNLLGQRHGRELLRDLENRVLSNSPLNPCPLSGVKVSRARSGFVGQTRNSRIRVEPWPSFWEPRPPHP
ncbi:ExeA family protein [Cryobacterium shii]|uniref:ExeA family protein n=1 Tax=Cryobacterium shii TaxID=1259235 RepID=UPI0013594773|nr:AAA family ATPase [Cryobacterium shii]